MTGESVLAIFGMATMSRKLRDIELIFYRKFIHAECYT